MKKILFSLIITAVTFTLKAQGDPVNEVFNKYANQEGYTTVNITGDFFKMLASNDNHNADLQKLSKSLSEVRILAQDDEKAGKPLDFYKLVYDKLDKSIYKELMTVKQSDQKVNMLVKENNGIISEFLMIVAGKDNVLINIKGNIKLSELSEMANSMDIKGFDKLKLVENVKDN